MRPADSALGIFRSPDPDLCVPGLDAHPKFGKKRGGRVDFIFDFQIT